MKQHEASAEMQQTPLVMRAKAVLLLTGIAGACAIRSVLVAYLNSLHVQPFENAPAAVG
jgi:hypothetical protein